MRQQASIATGYPYSSPQFTLTVVIALCWLTGAVFSLLNLDARVWIALLLACAAVMFVMAWFRRPAGVRAWALLAVAAGAGAWTTLDQQYTSPHDLRQFVGEQSQLASITGTVDSPARLTTRFNNDFAPFSYEPPATLFVLDAGSIRIGDRDEPCVGKVFVRMAGADHRLRTGSTVQVTGWLSAIEGPGNPGERDYRPVMAARGIFGRITLASRGNWHEIAPPGITTWLAHQHDRISAAAAQSLRLGWSEEEPAYHALALALLLGDRTLDLLPLQDAFTKVGLAHLLSISGAHLGILLGLTWMLLRIHVQKPPLLAALLLAILTLFMLCVPWQVPILRAAIMSLLFCLGYMLHRRWRALDTLATAMIIVLLWRPGDVFNAGFQLSFLGVAGLIVFTWPVSNWLRGGPDLSDKPPNITQRWVRKLADVTAASIVGFAVSMPVVAYHFQMISPMAVPLTLFALPLVTAMLAAGYIKIFLGMLLPSAGLILAYPLQLVTKALSSVVEHAQHWPGGWWSLSYQPSLVWTLAMLAWIVACFSGAFHRRMVVMLASLALCVLWLVVPAQPAVARWLDPMQRDAVLTLNMFNVADGSCFLLRIAPESTAPIRRDQVVMFDCGSQRYLDVGSSSIVPALHTLGVTHIDILLLSHADLDHFSGVLDVAQKVSIGRVLVPPQMLAEAQTNPDGPTAVLLSRLVAMDVSIEPIVRGWEQRAGQAKLRVLWPPNDQPIEKSNDSSLVLSIDAAGRRVLLNGDIQQQAITGLLALNESLRADVADLPHHGSFVAASPLWFDAVRPALVLQSCGRSNVRQDRWRELIEASKVTRLITAEHGMAQVTIASDGEVRWLTFK